MILFLEILTLCAAGVATCVDNQLEIFKIRLYYSVCFVIANI